MPVHLMPAPITGAGPPGKAAVLKTANPPALATLFAALLLQSGSSAPPITVSQTKTEPLEKDTETKTTDTKTTNYLEQTKAAKISRSLPLKRNAAAAKIQNAMDTPPVSLSSPGKSANRKPDGELPLSETRTSTSLGSSALPSLLPATSLPAAPVPMLPAPVSLVPASPVPGTPVLRTATLTAKTAPVTVPAERAAAPKPVAIASASFAAVMPLPKTFAILPRQAIGQAYIAEANVSHLPLPIQALPVQPLAQALIGSGQYEQIGSAVAAAPPASVAPLVMETGSKEMPTEPVATPVSMPSVLSVPPAESVPAWQLATPAISVPAAAAGEGKALALPVTPQPIATPALSRLEQRASVPVRTAPGSGSQAPPRQAPTQPEAAVAENLTAPPLPRETLPALQATDHTLVATRQGLPGVKSAGLTGKRLPAAEEKKAAASPASTPHVSENSRAPATGSTVLVAEQAAPEEAMSQPLNGVPKQDHASQTPGAEKVVSAAASTASAEKPLKTGSGSADTQTTNNTRIAVVPTRQPLSPQLPVTVAAKPAEKAVGSEKTAGGEVVPLLAAAAPAAAAPNKSAALPPLSHAERGQIVKQAAEGLGAMRLPTRPAVPEQMTIQLHPKNWGKLQVSVTFVPSSPQESVPGQKAVTAHMVAETPQIKAALESQVSDLHHALQASGMHLEGLTVSVQSPAHTESAHTGPAPVAAGGSQTQTNLGDGGRSGNGQPSGSTFASFGGNAQSGRQEQSPGYPTAVGFTEPEADADPLTLRQAIRGQIDTRA